MSEGLVKKGETCVFHTNDGRKFFLETTERIRVGKGFMAMDAIIGHPYGTVFELIEQKLVPVTGGLFPEPIAPAQKLSCEEIAELRASGASGNDIIQALVQSSDSWNNKTEFSKQKWLMKKQQKYIPRVRVLKLNAQNLCELYHLNKPDKINYLKEDTLAQILAYGNVFPHAQVLVVETCMGLVLGAIAERMGGHGRIMHGYSTNITTDVLRRFNFEKKILSSVIHFPLKYVSILHQTEAEIASIYEARRPVLTPDEIKQREEEARKRVEAYTDKQRKAWESRRAARDELRATQTNVVDIRNFLREQSDSLILACEYNAKSTLFRLLPLLKQSAPFVVHSPYIQPLVETFHALQEWGHAIKLQLSSTWTREYQVLPGRTHPEMSMSSGGGYLLTGIKVDASVSPVQQQQQPSISKKQKTN